MTEPTWYGPTTPSPGEFRIARFEDEFPRMVLVVAPVDGLEASNVWLVSTETRYATGADLFLDPNETGLPVPVIVETDMGFPLWNRQLDDPVGVISAEYRHLLRPMIGPDELPTARRGADVTAMWDARRVWKQEEYADIARLASDLFQELAAPAVERSFAEAGTAPLYWPAPLALIPGLELVVDILGGDAPPLVRWDPDSDEAVALARRVVEGDIASAVRALALAEERYALTGLAVWAVDSAVAAAELVEALDCPVYLAELLDERLPVAAEVLPDATGFDALRREAERRGLSVPVADVVAVDPVPSGRWAHIFDRESGAVVVAVEADGEIPEPSEAEGVLVFGGRHEHVDLLVVLSEVLAAAPFDAARASMLAESARRELGGAKAAELLESLVAALSPGPSAPRFMSGANETPGARLLSGTKDTAAAAGRVESPTGLAPERWAALVMNFADWIGGAVQVRRVAIALQGARASALEPRSFGLGVTMLPVAGRDDAVQLRIGGAALDIGLGAGVLAVIQDERGGILASHEFANPSRAETVELAVPDARAALTSSDVVVILMQRPAG